MEAGGGDGARPLILFMRFDMKPRVLWTGQSGVGSAASAAAAASAAGSARATMQTNATIARTILKIFTEFILMV